MMALADVKFRDPVKRFCHHSKIFLFTKLPNKCKALEEFL